MKKLPFILLVCLIGMFTFGACSLDDNSGTDPKWRKANAAFYAQEAASGKYTTAMAPWDSAAQVLMMWYNDTTITQGNLKPHFTSTVDVKYKVCLYNGVAVDSSFARKTPADSIFRTKLNSGIISGWPIAITRMHVGDSCRIVIPFEQAYGSVKVGLVPAYSTLVYDIKLVDIPNYETKQ